MKIAITGSDGFLGSHLRLSLEKDIDLIDFDKTKHSLFRSETLKSFLNDVDVVVHLAGANKDDNYGLFKTNVMGTAGLLEGMKQFSPNARIVFSSSFQAYEDSAYGISKKLAEDVVKSFSKFYGIKSIILRISNIYGPGGKPFYNSVIATFVHLIKSNKPIMINGTGEQKRDYIYVDDVVSAIKKTIYCSGSMSENFDICSEKLVSLNEIVGFLENDFKKEIKVEYNKEEVQQREEIERDCLHAKEKLKWRPLVDIEEGLRRTAQ